MTDTKMTTKTVVRGGRKFGAWSMTMETEFGCGHAGPITFHAEDGGRDRGLAGQFGGHGGDVANQHIAAANADCPWCRLRALGGGEFAGPEPRRWRD